MSVEFGSLGAFKKSIERVNFKQSLTVYKFPLCDVCNAFRLYFCFYCRHLFVSIALRKSLCYLLGRILVLATAFTYFN